MRPCAVFLIALLALVVRNPRPTGAQASGALESRATAVVTAPGTPATENVPRLIQINGTLKGSAERPALAPTAHIFTPAARPNRASSA
jgi:hypothetical protein